MAEASPAPSRLRPHEREQLQVGVGFAVRFLPSDIAVSLCATHSLLRFIEIAASCASPLRRTLLATSHRNGYEKDHKDDRYRDHGDDDSGAHLRASPPWRSCLRVGQELARDEGATLDLAGSFGTAPRPYPLGIGAKTAGWRATLNDVMDRSPRLLAQEGIPRSRRGLRPRHPRPVQ